ncbi:L-idonate 5-dehydrogenase [Burkholderia gladioli pv. gladioli]|uniref:L-idonate 5-dehydrogenase n=1 Tax=Burkholderia gladioli TaxID=28095 RepID=A0A095F0F2_BURGA|nr:L-idonate 5-dehydrogenase [Burkholderia gladioli]AJW97443.1 zinc-binding dehydrogenase family protein [Burkholderia gladioli]ASD79912.1 L-idonate 5-dehydrogenase [Burkholderia gladioli pv. gladioli]AWY54846.1 L-idonate 5-dehydrogenase [Burkholderia gladioli pv. gladioli]KGC11126.1 zinc-binding dehydrogenase family protein [Burkholderia gladioli]MDJ1164152.1 L-idonate 5-dehydrogenase [Burkholderia gladioli pv. gladioli]
MDALVIHAPLDLRIEDVPTPEPGEHQLLVRVRAGGICGSDLHYFNHGGFGTVRIREPMVLGHEVSGVVERTGPLVTDMAAGIRVAISPSRPCGLCRYCQQGLQNHCLDMRYYGSAMRTPHVQGAFRQEIVVDRSQAHVVADTLSDAEAAMTEPLSVALHAVRRAGPMLGKNVLVTGCGPIGALIVAAARRAGAAKIVATDVSSFPLEAAKKVGADITLNVAESPDALQPFAADKGSFDILFEASGNAAALRSAFDVLKPRGIVVQVGLAGEISLPINVIVAKEFDLRGAFRFHEEFAVAVELLNKGLVDVKPLITGIFHYKESLRAFQTAGDRSQSMKVLMTFE